MTGKRWDDAQMMPVNPSPVGSALPNPGLSALAAKNTGYRVWCEQPEGDHGPVRYIAQRKPGVTGGPYCLVTRDFDELRDLLA